jgi:hypothetical protein
LIHSHFSHTKIILIFIVGFTCAFNQLLSDTDIDIEDYNSLQCNIVKITTHRPLSIPKETQSYGIMIGESKDVNTIYLNIFTTFHQVGQKSSGGGTENINGDETTRATYINPQDSVKYIIIEYYQGNGCFDTLAFNDYWIDGNEKDDWAIIKVKKSRGINFIKIDNSKVAVYDRFKFIQPNWNKMNDVEISVERTLAAIIKFQNVDREGNEKITEGHSGLPVLSSNGIVGIFSYKTKTDTEKFAFIIPSSKILETCITKTRMLINTRVDSLEFVPKKFPSSMITSMMNFPPRYWGDLEEFWSGHFTAGIFESYIAYENRQWLDYFTFVFRIFYSNIKFVVDNDVEGEENLAKKFGIDRENFRKDFSLFLALKWPFGKYERETSNRGGHSTWYLQSGFNYSLWHEIGSWNNPCYSKGTVSPAPLSFHLGLGHEFLISDGFSFNFAYLFYFYGDNFDLVKNGFPIDIVHSLSFGLSWDPLGWNPFNFLEKLF